MSSALGYRDLISMAEANSTAKQREIEKRLRDSGKGKVADPKQAKLKVGVQKFLAKKEEEEKRLKDASLRKKRMLLELRSQDRKANSRVNRMLKMTKSANKSCIEDAQECLSEACTAQASETQPDEDDYGYTSTFANEMHKKMMEKYKAVPKAPAPIKKAYVEPPTPRKFDAPPSSTKSSKRHVISPRPESPKPTTNAIPRQKIPKKANINPPAFVDLLRLAEQKSKEPVVVKKPTKDMLDGPEFEYGRPMTAKEKAEYMSELALRNRVKANLAAGGGVYVKDTSKLNNTTNKSASNMDSKGRKTEMSNPRKDSKLETALTNGVDHYQSRNGPQKSDKRNNYTTSRASEQSSYSKPSPPFSQSSSFKPSAAAAARAMGPPHDKMAKLDIPNGHSSREINSSHLQIHKSNGYSQKSAPEGRKTYSGDSPRSRQAYSDDSHRSRQTFSDDSHRSRQTSSDNSSRNRQNYSDNSPRSRQNYSDNAPQNRQTYSDNSPRSRQSYSEDSPQSRQNYSHSAPRSRQPYSDDSQRNRQNYSDNPPRNRPTYSDNSPRSRPTYSDEAPRSRQPQQMEPRPKPAPLRTNVPHNSRNIPESGNRYDFPTRKKDSTAWKGRSVIHSDDEYDSEMDDFIDDSDVPQEDISNVIGQIFGYNKRKYANEDSDDECMESSVTQQWQEEQRSLRIGIKEDQEELRREQEEEKRKAMYLKRKQKLK